jgi:hypothetical protein
VRLPIFATKKPFKWTVGVAGTLLLSALGSGIWQSVLGPALHTSSRWLLDLASLGLASYKNRVYQQIAADNQSAVAVVMLIWVLVIYAFVLLGFNIRVFERNDDTLIRSQRLLQNLPGSPDSEPAVAVDTLRQDLVAIIRTTRLVSWGVYISLVFLGAAVVIQVVEVAKLSYVNSADAHYHQTLRVASPYLDTHEQAQVESDFAQIKSREDYVKVLSRLENQCKAHDKSVPEFDAW